MSYLHDISKDAEDFSCDLHDTDIIIIVFAGITTVLRAFRNGTQDTALQGGLRYLRQKKRFCSLTIALI